MLIALAITVMASAVVSEWRAVAWWSPVNLTGPHQSFIVFSSGEVRWGQRGTAGFFTRYIPPSGWMIREPERIPSEIRGRYWLPQVFRVGHTRGLAVPLWPIAAACLGLGIWQFRRSHRPVADRCGACGYDMSGLAPRAKCPECGHRDAG